MEEDKPYIGFKMTPEERARLEKVVERPLKKGQLLLVGPHRFEEAFPWYFKSFPLPGPNWFYALEVTKRGVTCIAAISSEGEKNFWRCAFMH